MRHSSSRLLLLLVLLSAVYVGPLPRASAASITFRPTPITLGNPELVNPLRGFVKWGGGSETVPQPEPAKDWTNRFIWRDVETSQGVYTWTVVDSYIAKARAEGRRAAIAFRDMRGDSIAFPDYLKPYAWSTIPNGQTTAVWVPNYNHPFYQERMRAFLKAAGLRYNNHPDVSWVDIRMYGFYGEWHLYGVDYTRAPSGITQPTEASKRAIVDAHIAAFPDTQLISMTDDRYALKYAMMDVTTRIPIGWRRDSGGNTHWDNGLNSNMNAYAGLRDVVLNRWKTAPVVMEPWNPPDATLMLQQVQNYHVAMIGNGNFGAAYSSATSTTQNTFVEAGKRAGYRYAIQQVTVDTPGGGQLNLATQWLNSGVTPVYEPWQARWELRNTSTNAVVWSGVSKVNFKTLLPTGTTPVLVSDAFVVPSTVASGTYKLTLTVVDGRGVRRPMQLAMSGKQSDGSYLLGNISL